MEGYSFGGGFVARKNNPRSPENTLRYEVKGLRNTAETGIQPAAAV